MDAQKNRMPCLLAIMAAGLFLFLLIGIIGIGAVWLSRAERPTPQAIATATRVLGDAIASPTAGKPTPVVGDQAATPTNAVVEIPKDKETCLAMGGKWGRIGIGSREECNLPTVDGGKVCTDTRDCEGMCLAELSPAERDQLVKNKAPLATKGKCTQWRIVVGCIARLEDGQVKTILCID